MSDKEIFVVDDDNFIRHLFERAFTKVGYTVTTAESAEDALDILKEKTFPVMFLDLKLPGMSGVDLCRIIKKEHTGAVVFAVTAYASIFELSDCLEAGFDDYFTKPVDLDTLFKVTKGVFENIESSK